MWICPKLIRVMRPVLATPRNALVFRFKDNVALDSANHTDASQPSDMGAPLRYLSHQITSYSS
jgi:hypothetical protein